MPETNDWKVLCNDLVFCRAEPDVGAIGLEIEENEEFYNIRFSLTAPMTAPATAGEWRQIGEALVYRLAATLQFMASMHQLQRSDVGRG